MNDRKKTCPEPHSREALDEFKRGLLEDAMTDYARDDLRAGSSEQIEDMHREARRRRARPRTK